MNKELQKLFKSDQADRTPDKIKSYDLVKNGWKLVVDRDVKRKKKVKEILKSGEELSGRDYFHAAMIFQHGQKLEDYTMAAKLAKKAVDLGYKNAKWLYAAATDRFLINSGRKQKFGTQYQRKNGKFTLMPVNKRTTDKQRREFNVPSLKEAKQRAREMEKIYKARK